MSFHIELPFTTAAADTVSRPIHLVCCEETSALNALLGTHAGFLKGQGFSARHGAFTLLPVEDGVGAAVLCIARDRQNDPTAYGVLGTALPTGDWRFVSHGLDAAALESAGLGFGMGAYRFSTDGALKLADNTQVRSSGARLVLDGDVTRVVALSKAIWLGRDLINMPANLMGPEDLAEAAREVLEERGAEVSIIAGDPLREAYPCLAEVGEGAERRPHVVVARWQGTGSSRSGKPRVSLVGKGVCFDTGGYDLKPAAGMLRMKKDMGGAALMLSVMCALIDCGLDIDLELRLGCVENSVSGRAMRPGDVLRTRSGKTVEIGNTDAEGRLVLCDLITEAAESSPDVIIDAATLTGAARVALGPDLPALFCNDDNLAATLIESGRETFDAMWQMPLWHGYDAWLDSKIADLGNVTSKPTAGAVTAALYLQRFVPNGQKWAHIDTYAWNDSDRAGRPEGGEVLALRAIFNAISQINNNP